MLKQRRNRCGYSVKYPREERVYRSMWNRCMNPNHASYKRYGAKGVTICERWLGYYGLQNFIDDMGPTPTDEKLPSGKSVWSIDRIDSTKGYSPDNCRWTNWVTQAGNRGTVHGTAGVKQIDGLWVVRHRTAKAVIRGSFATEEMAIEAKKDWEKKYPS